MRGIKGQDLRLEYAGSSHDDRTNKWRVYCPCGYINEPLSTILSRQVITCEKCSKEYFCDYNDEPPSIRKMVYDQLNDDLEEMRETKQK